MDQPCPDHILPPGFYLLRGADGTKLMHCAAAKALSECGAWLHSALEERCWSSSGMLGGIPKERKAASCKPQPLQDLSWQGCPVPTTINGSIKLAVKRISIKMCKQHPSSKCPTYPAKIRWVFSASLGFVMGRRWWPCPWWGYSFTLQKNKLNLRKIYPHKWIPNETDPSGATHKSRKITHYCMALIPALWSWGHPWFITEGLCTTQWAER